MSVIGIFFGAMGVLFAICVFGFFYGMSHPQKKSKTKTVITYDLDAHKFGVMYGFPDDSADDEEDDDAVS